MHKKPINPVIPPTVYPVFTTAAVTVAPQICAIPNVAANPITNAIAVPLNRIMYLYFIMKSDPVIIMPPGYLITHFFAFPFIAKITLSDL